MKRILTAVAMSIAFAMIPSTATWASQPASIDPGAKVEIGTACVMTHTSSVGC